MTDEETLHVVESTETLDASWVVDELQSALTDIGDWITNAQTHERTALCLWDGQSEDGQKWAKNYGRKVYPFDGCADSRVHVSGAAVDELTMLEMLAADSAKVQVIAMESSDAAASKRVETLMKYETRQRLRNELWRERNFAKQIKHTFGHAVMHIGWEERMGTARAKLTAQNLTDDLTNQLLAEARAAAQDAGKPADEQGEVLSPEQRMLIADQAAVQMEELLGAEDLSRVVKMIRQRHPLLSTARARRVAREIAKAGDDPVEFAAPYRKPGKPCVKALLPGFDVFYPWWVYRIDASPWTARVERYSEPELRAMVKTEGWSQKAVDAMITMGPTAVVDTAVLERTLQNVSHWMFNEPARMTMAQRLASKERTMYEALHITVQTVDEEGFPATQEIVLHPSLVGSERRGKGEELIFKNALVDYYFEGGCYVEMRREYKPARSLFESRGVPELVGTHQSLVKRGRDASMDRTSFATNPIVKVNSRRAGSGARWDYEPGSKLSIGPGDVAEYMQPPRLDQGTLLDEGAIRRDGANLLGLYHEELPQAKLQMHQQWTVTNALMEEREILLRILGMDQQFMEPLYVSRVMGNGPMPFQVTREEIAGSFDFVLEFDVKSLDMEYLEKRWSALKDAFSIPGVAGQVPTVPVVSWLLNNIDPGLADLVTGSLTERNTQQAEEEKAALAMMLTGIEPRVTEDMDASTRLAAIQEQMQTNPSVNAAYQQGGAFTDMLNARMQAFQFSIQQRTENAQTGRTGWKPVMAEAA
jgi:hypothetical protein